MMSLQVMLVLAIFRLTLLPKDVQRYLGIRTLKGTVAQELLTVALSPSPWPSLASRENLLSWSFAWLFPLFLRAVFKSARTLSSFPTTSSRS